MHILVAWCKTLLNISGFLLAAKDGYDSKSCWYFKTQVCRVQSNFECIREVPSKDSVIWVCQIDNSEGDVFGAGIFRGAEGHWGVMALTVSELLLIESHLIEGC
jgi:hypothetical protein